LLIGLLVSRQFRPSVGDPGTGGTNDLISKPIGSSRLIRNRFGTFPVARA
jgi:hypothetical protein